MSRPKTENQRFYKRDGQLKAEIDVDVTREDSEAPSINDCRFAVLQLNNERQGYVVYDRLLSRIVNGVFDGTELDMALVVAQRYNEKPDSPQDMSPNGFALGLIYPNQERADSREE